MENLPREQCGWAGPDGTRVVFPIQLVRDLRARAIEGFLALPRRGMEIGGVLYGRMDGAAIRIEEFAEIASEHRFGPSFALSEQDRAQVPEPGIGYFRSFASRESGPEPPDEPLARSQHPKGEFFLLTLHPVSHFSCLAEFWRFENSEPVADSYSGAFEFDPDRMHNEIPVSVEPPAPAPDPPPAPPVAPSSDLPPNLPPAYRARAVSPSLLTTEEPVIRQRRQWPLVLALVLASALLGAALYQVSILSGRPRWSELHIDVKPAGQQFEATWDGVAAKASGATRALLAVSEGTWRRDIALDESQIQAGRFSWQRTGEPGDIVVRLVLYKKAVGVGGDAVRLAAIPPGTAAPAKPVPGPPAPKTPPEVAVTVEPDAPAGGTAPQVVNQVQPIVPEGIRSRIERPVTIPVQVQVSAQGRVTHAKALDAGSSSVTRYLAGLAETAARQSRFHPARTRRGTKVASTATMQFLFTQ